MPKRKTPPPRRKTDVEMMQDADNWPRWPILPLKRITSGHVIEAGLLVNGGLDGPHTDPTVYLCNMYQPVTEITPTKKYESFEAIVADGWKVD